MTLEKGLTTLVFFGIGLGLFWLAMQGVEDPEAFETQHALRAMVGHCGVVCHGLPRHCVAWPEMESHARADGSSPVPARSVHAVAFSYFANAFVPRSGEVARCAALNQTDDIPVDQLFGTVITERVVDFLMLFGFLAIALATNLDAFGTLMDQHAMESPAMP